MFPMCLWTAPQACLQGIFLQLEQLLFFILESTMSTISADFLKVLSVVYLAKFVIIGHPIYDKLYGSVSLEREFAMFYVLCFFF